MVRSGFLVAWAGVLGGCGAEGPSEMPPTQLAVEVVAQGLIDPDYLTAPPGDARLFIVEQPGRIRILKDGSLLATPFLDLTDKVGYGGERGMFSVAFHPDYARNGWFYVDYTDTSGDTRVERYQVSADPDVADAASGALALGVPQPYANHNGGLVVFGPDGMLYVGLGDGGSGGDPSGNGQNKGTLLGAVLRLDVNAGSPYAIPPDNPFVSTPGARGEIWAWGLRNPWRFAFDAQTALLYIADVGQNAWEELDVAPSTAGGLNYGWNVMEGLECYNASSCDRAGLTLPVLVYDHSDGCSITGGYVYRGAALAGLAGHYFYADYCAGWVRSFRYTNGAATEDRDWALGALGPITSFGEDAAGELYILSQNGRAYRLIPAP